MHTPTRLAGYAIAVAFVQAAGLLFGLHASNARAEPTHGPAEYAFRWNAAQEKGPKNIAAAALLLDVSDKKKSTYRVQYAEVPRPTGLPQSVKVIARQRTELTGEDAGEIESSYKFRASSSLDGLAPEATFACLLKSATWESELDVGWSAQPGGAVTQAAEPAGPLVTTEVYSRTCSTKATLKAALPPQAMPSKPLSGECAAEMVRYKDGQKNLKLEQWQMPSGETLLEVSRKVEMDTDQARRDFQTKVVARLTGQGVIPSQESKTELSKCP